METTNRHWSIEDADYDQLINKAIDQAADAMGIVFAVHGIGRGQELAAIQLDIQDVNSIQKYRKLESYLRDLSAVETVKALKVNGQSAIFEVTLRSSEDDFLNLIKNDAELVEVKPVLPQDKGPEGIAAGSEKAAGAQTDDASGDTPNELSGSSAEAQPDGQLRKIPLYHYKFIN